MMCVTWLESGPSQIHCVTLVEPICVVWLFGTHWMHELRSSWGKSLNLLSGHGTQYLAPCRTPTPSGSGEMLVAKLPAEQSMHPADDPAAVENFPRGHEVHADAAAPLNFPGSQSSHTPEPSPAAVPGSHDGHEDAPWLVVTDTNEHPVSVNSPEVAPGAELEHAAALSGVDETWTLKRAMHVRPLG